jgi:hypothetical protein
MKAGEVDAGFGHQGGQSGNEVHGFQDDVGGAVPIWGLEGIADIAVRGEGESFGGDRRAGDISAQAFQLVPLVGLGGDPGMQGEAGSLGQYCIIFPVSGGRGW